MNFKIGPHISDFKQTYISLHMVMKSTLAPHTIAEWREKNIFNNSRTAKVQCKIIFQLAAHIIAEWWEINIFNNSRTAKAHCKIIFQLGSNQ